MIAHTHIVVLSVALLLGLSALHSASIAGAKPTHISSAKAAAAPEETIQSAQNAILIGAAFKSVSIGY